jgi:hypothetical protein
MLLDVGPAGGLRQVEDILHGVELMSAPAFTLRATLTGCLPPAISAPLRFCRSAPVRGLDAAPQLGGGVPEGFLEGFGGLGGLLGGLASGFLFVGGIGVYLIVSPQIW